MLKRLALLVAVALASLLVFWSPWILRVGVFWGIDFGHRGMETIVQNFDGLNFLIVAKSLYDPKAIEQINTIFPTGNTPNYFAAHYPLFGLVIRGFESFLSAPYALLASIVLSNILLAIGLYIFFETVTKRKDLATWLSLVALFFPARMMSVRAVGSNEPLFLFFVLMSLTFCLKSRHWLAALCGALAVLTRSPGILLFLAYGFAILVSYRFELKKMVANILPYLVMPLSLGGLFVFYWIRYGDFWAYFNSGDNLHLFFPPFMIFSNNTSWVSGMWREDLIYLYIFYGMGIASYIKNLQKQCGLEKLAVASFGLVYGLVLLFVSHRDLGRYALPVAPIALLGYAPLLAKKEIKIILTILIVPIFLLGWQFVVQNVQPINDWSALLLP